MLCLCWVREGCIRRIHIPRFEELSHGEEGSKENAQTPDDNVSDSQEWVPTAHNGSRGEEDGFRAAVDGDGEVCGEKEMVALVVCS